MFQERIQRKYLIRCRQEKILDEIAGCVQSGDVEKVVVRYDLCDLANMKGLNVATSRMLANIVVGLLYRYPRLRSRICYLGSKSGYHEVIDRLFVGDAATMENFRIQYIFTQSDVKQAAAEAKAAIGSFKPEGDPYFVAQAVSIMGILDAVMLDDADFKGLGYPKLIKTLKYNKEIGFLASADIEGVVYHEFGHMLDYMCNIYEHPLFTRYYNSLSPTEIKAGLSEYATTNVREFIAEAFSESSVSRSPRKIAADVGRIINDIYDNFKA